ncbi:MAG: SpoIIE family protein phosphatase [Lachnospiraceae bacterium]|nr:SpoIIE family protein phosphatase [Lachnospiraceae bacterium]
MKKHGIQRKVIIRLFLFSGIIIMLAGFLVGMGYYRTKMNEYSVYTYGFLHTASGFIDGDRIQGYLDTKEPDEYYDEILKYMTETRDNTILQLFYVFVPYEDDLVYIWQTDEEDPYSWLGKHEQYMEGGKETRDLVFRKDPIEEITFYRDEVYGDICCGFYPIFDSSGEPVALVGIDLSTPGIHKNIEVFVTIICLMILFVTMVAGTMYYRSLRRQIVDPIHQLDEAAKSITSDLEKEELPDIEIHTGDELETLSESFVKMYTDIRHYIDENTAISAEKGRIESELNVATQIQADMLPRIFPPFPDRKEFDIYATMTPAKEVGGDFYDFFFVDDDHLALVIADVSGKGVPAALFMVIAKTLIKNRAQLKGSPSEVLSYANEQLCEGNDANLFVTVWIAIIELSTGKGIAANAGHEHPALKRADGVFDLVTYRHSPAVATMEGMKFKEHEFEMHPGDILYVYTDGVTEATDSFDQLFGTERMVASLNSEDLTDPKQILDKVKEDIDIFVGDAPQFDDITMLCFKYNGK